MSKHDTAIGVDGCRSGWFYVRCRGGEFEHGVTTNLASLLARSPSPRLAIDIPIGLHDHSADMRRCDRDARRLLGPRRASVFTPPLRGALAFDRHADASAWQKARCGKGLSIQAFNIGNKIREVDALLRDNPAARAAVFEAHPELCFLGLNDGAPILANKKTDEGASLRMALLSNVMPEACAVLEEALATYRRKDVARDDIVDALVTLHVAGLASDQTLRVPLEPQTDAHGLPMSITLGADSTLKRRLTAALRATTPPTASTAR